MKQYIRVDVEFTPDGLMVPRSFRWTDGEQYKIDRVTAFKPSGESKVLANDRFTISVHGRESYLYFERLNTMMGNRIGRWYIIQ